MRSFGSVALPTAAVVGVVAGTVAWTGLSHTAGVPQAATVADLMRSADRAPDGTALLPPGHSWTVTLISGDVVRVTTVRGRPPLVTVSPAPGRGRVFFTKFVDSRGDIEVIPGDLARLIGRVLDPALFNVTTLIQNGDDNAHRSSLPLIVQGRPSGLAALPSLVRGPALASIGAVAAAEPRKAAVRVGGALAAMASAVARAWRISPQITGGISYVWLDRTVHATDAVPARVLADVTAHRAVLDHNLVQIGAPVAWRAGDTGAGVKVAVLDTGVDATFPDLRGQIAAERNFTSAQPHAVDDKVGHGTFVAALIAGTGRASGGTRRGVAFGSRLVIGKVLNDYGAGLDSWVIAGMQWAATRARIVNLSLGGGPSAGYDPVSEALNRLSRTHHVLFVVAAGNDGPSDDSVETPAAASAALAVGAVDGSDRLAPFSSQGPRRKNFAIKPEITAPGVNITGARAAGTSLGFPITARYTVGSGTSFAAPEVAGAAAILAALHPAWSPARLKGDIVSTAHPATGGDFYAVGGGMVDIATEISDPVMADKAIAGLGAAGTSSRAVRTSVTWSNTSHKAVRLKLSVRLAERFGHAAPTRSYGLSAASLLVPGGGQAAVGLVVRPRLLAGGPGLYEGQIIARDGKIIVKTPVGFYLRPPTHTLIIKATPLPGTAPKNFSSYGSIIDVSNPDLYNAFLGGISWYGHLTGHKLVVPDGHYMVLGVVADGLGRQAVEGYPEVNITRNTTLVLNGAAAVRATARVTGRRTVFDNLGVYVERAFAGQVDTLDEACYSGVDGCPPVTTSPVFEHFSGAARTGSFHIYSWFRLSNPPGSKPYFAYDLYHAINPANPATAAYTVTPAEQAKLAKVTMHFYALDGNHAQVEDNRYGLTPTGFLSVQNVSAYVPGGSTRTDYVSTGPEIRWNDEAVPPLTINGQNDTGNWVIEVPGYTSYKAGSRHVLNWIRQPFAPGPYSNTRLSESGCAPFQNVRVRRYIQVNLVDLQDEPDAYNCLGSSHPAMRLYLGSKLIDAVKSQYGFFKVPLRAATYRLTYTDNWSKILTVSTKTSTTWTFRSAAPAGSAMVNIPLLLVRYHLPLNLDNHPDGSTAILTVARMAGTPPARVLGLRLWTSVDGGKTWQPAAVRELGSGKFAATLPHVPAGQGVSLRVAAADAGGSKIDQTIITAYHG
ncbi:MAG TPA: S8 family serine peptidase [Streptosporangiaceae bacterium]|nr:S8 family serine peptidase [Streptosporangiaceae bacterium]